MNKHLNTVASMIVIALFAFGAAASAFQDQAAAPPGGAAAPESGPAVPLDYVIGAQDVLAVSLFDQPELGGKFAVELDGTFTFPLLGRVKAGGLTIRQFESLLKTRLVSEGFFRDPQISIGVDQYRSQRVFVVGEVRTPGTYPLTRDTTLIELLSKAGSTTATAGDDAIIVRGQGQSTAGPTLPPDDESASNVIHVNLKDLQSGLLVEAIELRDGDTVFVARAEEVFVFGEVKNPGSYPIKTGTTVLQALSLAGGVTPSGATGRIKIMRFVGGRKVEVDDVELTDPVQPADTIMVPERLF
jgi:polysaccharide export outer membrane protein